MGTTPDGLARLAAAILLLAVTSRANPQSASGPAAQTMISDSRLGNPFIRTEHAGFTLRNVRADPDGRDRFSDVLFHDIHAPAVRITEPLAPPTVTSISFKGELTDTQILETGSGNDTVATLQPAGVIGFVHPLPPTCWLTHVQVLVGTHHTSDSEVTLEVRRDNSSGELIAHKHFTAIPDNSWLDLAVPQAPATNVWLGLSNLKGQLSWWATRSPPLAGIRNDFNGDRNTEMTLRARLTTKRIVMPVTAAWQLRFSELIATITPTAEPEGRVPATVRWELRCPWVKDGYDVSASTCAFQAFYADTGQFVTAHQMKRRDHLGLRIGPAEAITAWGLRGVDARFTTAAGAQPQMQLHGEPSRLVMALETPTRPPVVGSPLTVLKISLTGKGNALPSGMPHISCDDPTISEMSTRFLWDRALSYPPAPGPSAWFEWNGLIRNWLHLPLLRDPERDVLAGTPITAEGYVHTWGQTIGWPFPDGSKYDTRHFDSNARFILGVYRWVAWRRDKTFLQEQLARIRLAMEYQLGPLQGEKGLIISNSRNNQGRHGDVGGNYWDILPFGHKDAYCNIAFFASLHAMAEMESMAVRWLSDSERNTKVPGRSPEAYQELRRKVRDAYNKAFWNDQAGRYIGCIDADGNRHDYGFTFVNLEAMAYGLADRDQAQRIYYWMEYQPTSTGERDTYSAFIFAPRATTLHNPIKNDLADIARAGRPPWWCMDWGGTPFGEQCQDGGAILYTSYYDILARATLIHPDNAWKRYREILDRYAMPDRLCGGPPLFRGETPQQENPGAVGVDLPFPESGLVPASLLYAFMGVMPEADGLRITPRIPSELKGIRIQPIACGDYRLDINVGHARVRLLAQGKASLDTTVSFKRGESLLLGCDDDRLELVASPAAK